MLRQAVVVIHGMGSQRPRRTVFDAAQASVASRVEYPDVPRLISRPDKVSHGFDARDENDRPRPSTDLHRHMLSLSARKRRLRRLRALQAKARSGRLLGQHGPLFRRGFHLRADAEEQGGLTAEERRELAQLLLRTPEDLDATPMSPEKRAWLKRIHPYYD